MVGSVFFGSGRLFITDSSGASREAGELKDISVEFSQSTKELRAGRKFALAVGVDSQDISGKVGAATFDLALMAQILGGSVSAGSKDVATETFTTGTTCTPTQSANFDMALSVTDGNDVPLTKVASAPAAGQYSVAPSTGVVTLGTAATGSAPVKYTYRYKKPSTGNTVAFTNSLQGAVTTFTMVLSESFNGIALTLKLNAAYFPKLADAFKAGEFQDISLDFKVQADSANAVGELTLG